MNPLRIVPVLVALTLFIIVIRMVMGLGTTDPTDNCECVHYGPIVVEYIEQGDEWIVADRRIEFP